MTTLKHYASAVSPAVQQILDRAAARASRAGAGAGRLGRRAATRVREADQRVLIAGGVVLAAAAVAGAVLAVRALKSGKGEGARDGRRAKDGDKFIERSVTINKPRDALYRQWRDFSNLPRWMETVESVSANGDGRAHWVVRGPGDRKVEFDTVLTEDTPGEVIAWESVAGDVRTESRIEFKDAPGGRGTEVHAKVDYHPPLGPLGRIAAVVTQTGPELQARRDLKRFKQLMETGEIATTEGPGAAPSAKYNKKH